MRQLKLHMAALLAGMAGLKFNNTKLEVFIIKITQ